MIMALKTGHLVTQRWKKRKLSLICEWNWETMVMYFHTKLCMNDHHRDLHSTGKLQKISLIMRMKMEDPWIHCAMGQTSRKRPQRVLVLALVWQIIFCNPKQGILLNFKIISSALARSTIHNCSSHVGPTYIKFVSRNWLFNWSFEKHIKHQFWYKAGAQDVELQTLTLQRCQSLQLNNVEQHF